MEVLHVLMFAWNVFDSRQLRISVPGSGIYLTRERGCSIDPLYVDDPLFPTNNVGRNCFRIHQCIKVRCSWFQYDPDKLEQWSRVPFGVGPKIQRHEYGHLSQKL